MRKIGGCLALAFVAVVYIVLVAELYQWIQPGDGTVFMVCVIVATCVLFFPINSLIRKWKAHAQRVEQERLKQSEALSANADKLPGAEDWYVIPARTCLHCGLSFEETSGPRQLTHHGTRFKPLRCPVCGSKNMMKRSADGKHLELLV